MSKETPVFEDLESVAESVYYILLNNGDDLLAEYIMNFKWDIPKPIIHENINLYHSSFIPYIEKYKKTNERNVAFKLDYTNEVLADLPTDFLRIKQLLKPNLAGIHVILNDYFESKLNYLKLSSYFALQFKYVSELINNVLRSIPIDRSKEIRDKLAEEKDTQRDQERKLRDEAREKGEKYDPNIYKSYELQDKSILTKNTVREFKLSYPALENLKISGITLKEIKKLERDFLENPAEQEKQRAENYFKAKRNLITNRYPKEFNRSYKQIQKKFIKMTKKFMKALFKYKDSIVLKPKGEGAGWGI